MQKLATAAAILGMMVAGPALAETTGSTATQQNAQAASPGAAQQNLAAAQKIKQDLQSAGFQDVNVVAESFVVQAKTKDGNPVVMTIGPHGMSVFEAMNVGNSANSGKSASNTGAATSQSGKTTQQ